MTELDTSPSVHTDAEARRHRRRTLTKFGLAGLAVLGIGAAATSAAWTDDAWFTGTASAANVELQGASSVTPLVWIDADTAAAAVVIPPATWADMLPGESVAETINLRNTSTVPLVVAAPSVVTTGAFFGGTEPATVSIGTPTFPVTLAPGATSAVTLTIATPAWDNVDTAYQGSTGTLTLQFTGTP